MNPKQHDALGMGGRITAAIYKILHDSLPLLAVVVLLSLQAQGATITVTSFGDNGPGSLRNAIAGAGSGDIIDCTGLIGGIILTNGELVVTQNVTIAGPGAKVLSVGNGFGVNGIDQGRIFNIAQTATVRISGLTIGPGLISGSPAQGGGIYNAGNLTLIGCHLFSNFATGTTDPIGGGGDAEGAGIYNTGVLSMNGCTLSGNSASGGNGGAGGGAAKGSGLFNDFNGSFALLNCTIAHNLAVGGITTGAGVGGVAAGGGIADYSMATNVLVNCTVSDNQLEFGDWIYLPYEDGSGGGYGFSGGGIMSLNNHLSLLNTILAGNFPGFNPAAPNPVIVNFIFNDYTGSFTSLGHNLIGMSPWAWPVATGDRAGLSPFDTILLGSLADNGGQTPTMAIGQASLAREAGDDSVLGGPYNLLTDQRGNVRRGGAHVDIGAYEATALPGSCAVCLTCCHSVSWGLGVGGTWGFSSAWTSNAPPDPNASVLITNAGTKTITVDNFTSTNELSMIDLTVSAPSNVVNTLLINNLGSSPFYVGSSLAMLSGSSLIATSSIIQINNHRNNPPPPPPTSATNYFDNGNQVIFDGPASFNAASLIASNAFGTAIGNAAPGSLGVTNGTLQAFDLLVSCGSSGTASFVNSTSTLSRALFVATQSGQTGQVSIAGGQFVATNDLGSNGFSLVLDRGVGTLAVSSNATAQFGNAIIGNLGSGTVTISSGSLSLGQSYLGMEGGIGGQTGKGTLSVLGGQTTIQGLHIGAAGTGTVTVVNGTISNSVVTMAEQPGSYGSLQVFGGAFLVGSSMTVGGASNSTGVVTVTSGTLDCSQGLVQIGPQGAGQLIISNGTVTAQRMKLGGSSTLASGLMRLVNGTLRILGLNGCTTCGFSTNDGEVDGGNLDASGTSILIGEGHNSVFTVTGGTVEADNVYVGFSTGFTGTYTQTGGSVTLSTGFTVGGGCGGAVGNASLSGSGILYVTNAAHNAVLNVTDGTFTMNGGSLVVDKLVVTNSCGHFIHNGGSLTYGQLILDPNQDADGDGIANGVEQANGTDPLSPNVFQVVNLNDSGAGSLRAAVASANATSNSTITFANGLTGTITLTTGEIPITGTLAIFGPGAKILTVSGNDASRIFNVTGSATVNGLTLRGGYQNNSNHGGALLNTGTLSLMNCVLTQNHADLDGGAIRNAGTLRVTACTFNGNSAGASGGTVGGAIDNLGLATLLSCTFANNSAIFGGGIGNESPGTLLVTNCTIAANTGANNAQGGGIYGDGAVTIQNTIIAGNSAGTGPDYYKLGTLASGGYNLIGKSDGSSGWTALDLVGTSATPLNPRLDPIGLRDNGGSTPTIALLPNSPAIDHGISGATLVDQRQDGSVGITGGPDVWQSFTAGVSGRLTEVGLGVFGSPSSPSNSPGTLQIYAGEGTGGALLATASITFVNVQGVQLFSVPAAPQVVAGNQYTMRFTVPSAPFAWVQVDTSNPYAGGRAADGPNFDYVFRTYVVPQTTDQRGQTRAYDFPYIPNAYLGDGSDIGAFELAPPSLSVVRSGNSITMSWPSPAPGFVLYQNTNLASPGGWTPYPGTITDNGVTRSATLNAPSGTLFFRLGP